MSRHFASSIQPRLIEAIDEVCNDAVDASELLVIDRLELDLGLVRPDSMERDLLVLVREKLRAELQIRRNERTLEERRELLHQSTLENILYALKTGTLPWWAVSDTFDLNEQILLLDAPSLQWLLNALRETQDASYAWERMALRCSDDAIALIVGSSSILTSAVQAFFERINQLKTSYTGILDSVATSKQTVAREIIRAGGSLLSGSDTNSALARMMMNLVVAAVGQDIAIAGPEGASIISTIETLFSLSAGSLQAVLSHTEEPVPSMKTDTILSSPQGSTGIDAIESLSTNTAGLVIAAVYIPMFFERHGFTRNNEFVSGAHRFEAVQALGYLSYGRGDVEEHLLVMEKLWCGLDLREPIPPGAPMTSERCAQCDELLHAIVENWSVLKNTSIAGLRETFLRRPGLLERREHSWHLVVERRTVDVLLERLPWTISRVTFPWTNLPIEVEW
ncbi:MAG: hypothetical protein JSS75_00740 [Bacteroidetes bacterium]|nr:hypothetical protein [Bacteroidota bacterium]